MTEKNEQKKDIHNPYRLFCLCWCVGVIVRSSSSLTKWLEHRDEIAPDKYWLFVAWAGLSLVFLLVSSITVIHLGMQRNRS